MQLMRMAEVPAADRNRVFRYSGSRALIGTAVLVALAVGALLLAWTTVNWLAYYFAAMARRLYAYDLTQAKDFIEGLANKRTPQA